jgi:alkanesulfonate monooxygenase SsuD/methylene tetrahydromethanopterin reductase-like flavin-dependent oxidoreductase (luciferase family)
VRLGATLVHLSPGSPYVVARWARELVDAGFDSLWVPQVVGRGCLVPDPFVTLAVAATVTEGVALGTATLQVPLHHPVDLAHRILSLASVCGDRLTVGVSPGSTEADFAALGRDHTARFRAFDLHLTRLRVLLAAGGDERVDLAPAVAAAPGLPILLGSWGARVERAAREFDGWLASGYRRTPGEILAAHERYRAAGGRRAVVCHIPVRGRADLGPTREALHRYADSGLDEAVVLFEPGAPGPEDVRALLP